MKCNNTWHVIDPQEMVGPGPCPPSRRAPPESLISRHTWPGSSFLRISQELKLALFPEEPQPTLKA